MEKIHVRTAVIIALIATVFGSLVAPSLVTARTGIMAGTASAVFGRVYGTDWVWLSTTWQSIMSIDLPFLGQRLYYKVECDGCISAADAVCFIVIEVDGAGHDNYSFRRYGAPDGDELEEFDSGIHTERLYYLDPGAHSFEVWASLSPTGDYPEAACNAMSITVTVYTHGALEEPVAEFEADINFTRANDQ